MEQGVKVFEYWEVNYEWDYEEAFATYEEALKTYNMYVKDKMESVGLYRVEVLCWSDEVLTFERKELAYSP